MAVVKIHLCSFLSGFITNVHVSLHAGSMAGFSAALSPFVSILVPDHAVWMSGVWAALSPFASLFVVLLVFLQAGCMARFSVGLVSLCFFFKAVHPTDAETACVEMRKFQPPGEGPQLVSVPHLYRVSRRSIPIDKRRPSTLAGLINPFGKGTPRCCGQEERLSCLKVIPMDTQKAPGISFLESRFSKWHSVFSFEQKNPVCLHRWYISAQAPCRNWDRVLSNWM